MFTYSMAHLNFESENVTLVNSQCDMREQQLRDRSETRFKPINQHAVSKLRYVTSYVAVVLRLLLPVCLAMYYAWLRNQRTVVNGVRQQLGPAVLAVISLSSISGSVFLPSSKLDPILRTFKVIKFRPRQLVEQSENTQRADKVDTSEPERCVNCEVLYDPSPEQIRADVIFIHGLHGSLDKTWKQGNWDVRKVRTVPVPRKNSHDGKTCRSRSSQNGSFAEGNERRVDLSGDRVNNEREPYSTCWPRDWLPQDCPGVRIITLSYTTDPYLWRPLWMTKRNRTCMVERSREMMDHLMKIGVGKNPIIWVGHSKGGLFVKQMIVDAFESGDDNLTGFYYNTRGIMFYSVPHRGSPCADFNLPLLRQSVELTEVQKNCREVLELHTKFLSLIDKKLLQVEIFSFIETVQTFMAFLYIQIVSIESADLGIGELCGAPLDHRNICKPSSRQCFLYRELANLINRTV
ncbi:protein SERAC1 isoform X2 [Zootermopsis nevadensis]|uniref:Protein SERAC1 n=1 Tax=Zootermopsis nevadensis TaxID=136037 RepID=A0A067R604_ZOONE|nr:protein SERAC1 isoform X2 [Zootermopsis nevadensis]KDR18789.1 Protein SERAC1 [Zootermopsis nevadensis]